MGFGFSDGDDVKIKGDNGTDDGALITATEDGGKYKLDVSASIFEDVVGISRSLGFHEGEVYDQIVCSNMPPDSKVLEFSFEDLCTFQIVATRNVDGFTLKKRPCEAFLLTEDDCFLLAEDGDKLKVSGLIPL